MLKIGRKYNPACMHPHSSICSAQTLRSTNDSMIACPENGNKAGEGPEAQVL